MFVFVLTTQFGISLYDSATLFFYKKSFPPIYVFFLILRESEDKQKPVLVSAHHLQKICQIFTFTETKIPWPPNMLHSFPGWDMKDNWHKDFLVNTLFTICSWWMTWGHWIWLKKKKNSFIRPVIMTKKHFAQAPTTFRHGDTLYWIIVYVTPSLFGLSKC